MGGGEKKAKRAAGGKKKVAPAAAKVKPAKSAAAKMKRPKKAAPTPNPSPPFAARMGGGEQKKRGPKPGTPSPLKFDYAPEVLADFRHRYEVLGEAVMSIARDYGMDETTIRRLANHQGWHRPPPSPRDLPAVVRLRHDVEALAAQMQAAVADGAAAPPGEGDGSGAAPAAKPAPDFAPAIARLLSEVDAQSARVRAARLAMKNLPEKPADAQRTASTLASLTRTLRDLQRMNCASAQGYDDEFDDDFPTDLDAYRDELARRIREFVASRTGARDADGASGGGPVSAP
jgi:hypothetical protein